MRLFDRFFIQIDLCKIGTTSGEGNVMNSELIKMAFKGTAILALGFSLIGSVEAKQTTFTVEDDMGRDVVSFASKAPIELVEGRTGKIKGTVVLDDTLDLSKTPIEANFSVDLASIDTGIEMRNQHMRDNFLETSKFPVARFKLRTLEEKRAVLKPGQSVTITAEGEFTVHGTTVTKYIPVDVTYFGPCPEAQKKSHACDAIVIRTTFPVTLAQHDIKRPEMLFQKLAETVHVTVSATARRNADAVQTSSR